MASDVEDLWWYEGIDRVTVAFPAPQKVVVTEDHGAMCLRVTADGQKHIVTHRALERMQFSFPGFLEPPR